MACVEMIQLPVAGSQQAPTGGHGLGSHVVFIPSQPPEQFASMVMVHPPVIGLQQAPTGGQRPGRQVECGPFQMFGGQQSASSFIVHAPVVTSQQAPGSELLSRSRDTNAS